MFPVSPLSSASSQPILKLDTASYITSTAVSSNSSYLAFGDAVGTIHLLTAADESSEPFFNGFHGQPVEWADTPEVLPNINWSDSTYVATLSFSSYADLPRSSPLNSIGMPHYTDLLLSSWTPRFLSSSNPPYPPPAKIPPQILSAIKINDNVAYAALPKELRGRRNRVVVNAAKDQGRFRSGKGRRDDDVSLSNVLPSDATHLYHRSSSNISPSTIELTRYPAYIAKSRSSTPNSESKTLISGTSFIVSSLLLLISSFRFYNKTAYSGLETHILNSYTNPVLQVMHYTLPIRKLARSHITTNCPREHCLLCELGFVVRMLEDAHGTNCQSSNFCRTVGVLAQGKIPSHLVPNLLSKDMQ